MSSVINFYPFKLELPISRNSTVVYKYSDIMYIKFDKPYSVFYLMDCERKKRYSVSVSMAKIERNLPRILFRCNPTTIINYCYIKEYLIHKTGILIMIDDTIITISKRKMRDFKIRKASLTRLTPLCERCHLCSSKDCQARDAFCIKEKLE
ncbi:MAG: LytTR family transcriptional regulator DNA-binding domain-containing protein [Bacteroidales bacterium]|jgi:hypothetical protein|nr:LytTR family transcriptional regulator DNA-binding domain-containing protein [Bacteroidales bacterium]